MLTCIVLARQTRVAPESFTRQHELGHKGNASLNELAMQGCSEQHCRSSPGMIGVGRGLRILREGSGAQVQFFLRAQGIGKEHKPCSSLAGWHRWGDRVHQDGA